MGTMKIWDGTTWQLVAQNGPAGPVVLPVGGTTGQVLAKQSGSDYDTAWRHDGVATFPTAAARTAAIPVPVLNQLTMLDSRPGAVSYWNSSAWVDTAPFVQSGIVTGVTADANGYYLMNFPKPFASPPAFTLANMTSQFRLLTLNGNTSATAVQIGSYTTTGARVPNDPLQFHWIAVGTAP